MRAPTVVCAGLAALLAASAAPGQTGGTRDAEKIIDVSELATAVQRATEPVSQRLRSSQLKQRFQEVRLLLEQPDVDKQELLTALRELQAEIATFTQDWDDLTEPLWEGQEKLAETIERVRLMLAGSPQGAPADDRAAKMLAGYDQRLTALAKAVEAEADPARRKRLKQAFGNVLALRRLTEKLGGVNLTPATETLQVRIVQVLTGLQDQLTQATFDVEKVRLVLASEGQFLANYIAVLEGMIEAEELARLLGQMEAGGTDIAGVSIDVAALQTSAEDFVETMNGFAGQMADSIEAETAKLAAQTEATSGLDEAAIDAEIQRYLQTASQAPAGE